MQDARSTETGMYILVHEAFEHRATQQIARAVGLPACRFFH